MYGRLWTLRIWDAIDCMPDPKPPYNTVSTVRFWKRKFPFHRQVATRMIIRWHPCTYANHLNGFSRIFSHLFPKMAAFRAKNNLSMKDLEDHEAYRRNPRPKITHE
jgi:hypothetical protein